jgi:hypothetical protein
MLKSFKDNFNFLSKFYYPLSIFSLLLVLYVLFTPSKLAFQAPTLFFFLTIPLYTIQMVLKQLRFTEYLLEKFPNSHKGSFNISSIFLEYYLSKKVLYIKQPDSFIISKLNEICIQVNRILLSITLFFLFLIITAFFR